MWVYYVVSDVVLQTWSGKYQEIYINYNKQMITKIEVKSWNNIFPSDNFIVDNLLILWWTYFDHEILYFCYQFEIYCIFLLRKINRHLLFAIYHNKFPAVSSLNFSTNFHYVLVIILHLLFTWKLPYTRHMINISIR